MYMLFELLYLYVLALLVANFVVNVVFDTNIINLLPSCTSYNSFILVYSVYKLLALYISFYLLDLAVS